MPRPTVDISRIQPAQGVLVNKANTPGVRDMPPSRGSMYASEPVPTKNVPRKPKLTVANLPPGTPDLDLAPVPPASVYEEPPAKVTASQTSHPAWLA